MGEVETGHSRIQQLGFEDTELVNSEVRPNVDHCCPSNEVEETEDSTVICDPLERGLMEYGCQHYRRRCRVRAPCCNEIFDCRHCHNEAKVICTLCGTEQEVNQVCVNCGVCMGKYLCEICKLFDDDISKGQYHCDGCGICRIGRRENFFHCYKCGCCYSILLKNSHPCVEGAMHHDCPVCFEFLFESRSDITVMPCGHTIHTNCLKEMSEHFQYACPLCSKSVCDMPKVWEKFDMEIAATPMPEPYQNRLVWILCNDCGKSSEVPFHLVAQKRLNSPNLRVKEVVPNLGYSQNGVVPISKEKPTMGLCQGS